MVSFERVYVVDPDSRRRAQFSKVCYEAGLHAEPCQTVEEFRGVAQKNGMVFCADDPSDSAGLFEQIQSVFDKSGMRLPTSIYSVEPTTERIVKAMLGGALSYLVWPIDVDTLSRAVRMTPEQVSLANLQIKQAEARAQVASLSPREREVLREITRGHSNKSIARSFDISPRTVEVHRASLIEKLQLETSSDAIRVGIYAGLDED